jgi:hypothetical protein
MTANRFGIIKVLRRVGRFQNSSFSQSSKIVDVGK